jgi:general secretion pathway protein B
MDVHAYATKPAERFVVINLRRYAIGDSLPEGPRVVDIVPQGVILEFHATRFLLPAS